MKKLVIVIVICLAVISGCASNGKHLYVDGRCISCWNDVRTGQPIDSGDIGANHLAVLNWNDLIITQLRENHVSSVEPYAHDYLKYVEGINYSNIARNEITLRKSIAGAKGELNHLVSSNQLKNRYQFTFPSQLEEYDFEKGEFPVRMAAEISTNPNRSDLTNLPNEIVVQIENSNEIPGWKIRENEAEAFLNGRRMSKGIYVRYILSSVKYVAPAVFSAKVDEVQFINVKPSVVTRENKEKHEPTKIVKML